MSSMRYGMVLAVKEHIAAVSKQLGDEIAIRRFVRFQVGESAA